MAPRKLSKKPKLSRVIPHLIKKIPETPEGIRKLFKPLENLDLDSGSDISDISDVFEGYHTETFLLRKGEDKALSTVEANKKTVHQFTEDYKKVMTELRNEMNLNNTNIAHETLEDVIKALESTKEPEKLPDTVMEQIQRILDECDVITSIPSPILNEPQQRARKSSTFSYDAESGIWKMLTSNVEQQKFTISPPGFNIFKQEEPHWLDRESVSWEVIDTSKIKCEKWLQERE